MEIFAFSVTDDGFMYISSAKYYIQLYRPIPMRLGINEAIMINLDCVDFKGLSHINIVF